MSDDVSLNDVATLATESEEVPSLAEFADEPGGAWKPGWYAAEILEGYATQKGKVFETSDSLSKNGDSRNLRLCVRLSDKDAERNMQESYNYRPSDFSQERLQFIKESREENKGAKGRWPDTDAQRSSLAIAKLGQIEKALGMRLKRTPDGTLVAAVFIGQKADVRLGIDENGYNVITAFAPAGSKAAKR